MRWGYRCCECGAEYEIEPGRYLCDPCASRNAAGTPLHGVLECFFETARGETMDGGSIPLPVERRHFPPIPVGDTPLWAPERLRQYLGFPGLWLKDDTCEPSGSFKDRASYLVAAFARSHGLGEVALASTGNAASSMACVGAAAGLKVTVFVPATAPVAKRVQVLQYGAELREIAGTYDLAFDTCLEYTSSTGVLSRNTAYNPLTIEGKKTASFEIVRDLSRQRARGVARDLGPGAGASRAPDHVFVPTGDGVIIAGVYRGFEDLLALGLIDRMPRVWAAQAEGSSAIARALATGSFEPRPSSTLADSIAVDAPRNGHFALAKMRRHGGAAVVVTDEEILEAQRLGSSRAGLFAEPSSACALAGFIKARRELGRGETAVVLLTGSGLKDVRSAARAVGLDSDGARER
jgi:threonine synthase